MILYVRRCAVEQYSNLHKLLCCQLQKAAFIIKPGSEVKSSVYRLLFFKGKGSVHLLFSKLFAKHVQSQTADIL